MPEFADNFIAHLTAYPTRGDGDASNDVNVLVEVAEVLKDGTVEIFWRDRNETVHLQFRLADLVDHVLRFAVKE
jgi:hypothetical protein